MLHGFPYLLSFQITELFTMLVDIKWYLFLTNPLSTVYAAFPFILCNHTERILYNTVQLTVFYYILTTILIHTIRK